jgi:hypothetical protein
VQKQIIMADKDSKKKEYGWTASEHLRIGRFKYQLHKLYKI